MSVSIDKSSSIEPTNNFETNNRGRLSSGRSSSSRYDGRTHNTRDLGQGRMVSSQNADTVIGSVVDPLGDGKCRVVAGINRRVDLLELERSHKRISEAAYLTGRQIQAVFEKMGGVSGTNWSGTSRVDAGKALETRIEKSVEHARVITDLVERMRSRLGMIDTRLLRRIIGDRLSYSECAGIEGKGGERGERYIAARFRDGLEDLAEAWTAKGKVQPVPDDKHKAAAEKAIKIHRSIRKAIPPSGR